MNKIKLYVAATTAAEQVIAGAITDPKAIAEIQAAAFAGAGFTAQSDYDEFAANYTVQSALFKKYFTMKTPSETAQAGLVAFVKPA